MHEKPVLYLDLDDTVISWRSGRPAGGAGLHEFLSWALETFEVRWLSRWARDGRMPPDLLRDLERMSGIPARRLAGIGGLDWSESDSKLEGIAWLEHVVRERPFVWLEDDNLGPHVPDFLTRHGFAGAHQVCNVTQDVGAVERLHRRLRALFAPGARSRGSAPGATMV